MPESFDRTFRLRSLLDLENPPCARHSRAYIANPDDAARAAKEHLTKVAGEVGISWE